MRADPAALANSRAALPNACVGPHAPMAALALASALLPCATAATRYNPAAAHVAFGTPQRGGRLRGEVAAQVGPALGSSSDGGEGAPSGSSSGGGEGPELQHDESAARSEVLRKPTPPL
jgi:hypothetical protein